MKKAIANQKQIETMGQKNLEKVRSWSWDYVVAETLKVYSG